MLRIRTTLSEIIGPQPGERLNKHLGRAMTASPDEEAA
jgi:hypothetical protein